MKGREERRGGKGGGKKGGRRGEEGGKNTNWFPLEIGNGRDFSILIYCFVFDFLLNFSFRNFRLFIIIIIIRIICFVLFCFDMI